MTIVDQLRELEALDEGSLEDYSFPLVLLSLHLRQWSGHLAVRRPPLEKQIVFDSGSPVDCRSNVATEMLGRFLVSLGKLTEIDLNSALAEAGERKLFLGEVLIERGLISPSDLLRMLQASLARKLLDLFSWRHGTFEISRETIAVATPQKVRVPQLVLTGIMKFAGSDDVQQAVLHLEQVRVVLNHRPVIGIDELRLSPAQAEVARSLERPTTIENLRATTSLEGDDFSRLIYALHSLGILSPAADPKTASLTPPALELDIDEPLPRPAQKSTVEEKRPIRPADPVPASPAVSDPKRRDELLRLFMTYRRKDPFEFFDLPDDASPRAVVRRFLEFVDRYRPDRFPFDSPDGLRDKAEELFLAAARAYAALADEDQRTTLITRRQRSREQPFEESLDSGGSLIDPEAQFRRGRKLMTEGHHRDALAYIELASDSDPQNGTYASELAWLRFHLLITTAIQTLNALKEVMRIDPNCGLAWYYTGRVHAATGNRLEAEAYLRKAQTMMGRDPRPAKALEALTARA